MTDRGVDANPAYWDEYTNLQYVKHALIRRYLGGWFAKLGAWARDVIYIDTHAGRGRHATGQLGSPLLALDTLLSHSHRDRLLAASRFTFYFIERDQDNLDILRREIASKGPLPPAVRVVPQAGNCFRLLSAMLSELQDSGEQLAPTFAFIDPYGFKVPASVLASLLAAGRVELFINIMWRELDMARVQARPGSALDRALDDVFGGTGWREQIAGATSDERADAAVNLIARRLGGRWPTYIRMLGDNNATRYLLLHLTNHDEGRDLMKECVWKICPAGGFFARKSDNPAQQILVTPKPDLRPLRAWILERLASGPVRWSTLHEMIRPSVWRDVHVNEVVRGLRRTMAIRASDYHGKFSAKANPLLAVEGFDR